MKSLFIFILCLLLLSSLGCALRDNSFEEYSAFAIKSARMGLWDEAIMRWKRMADLHPNDARTHNNLAVAYEAKGEMEQAKIEYEKTVKLDPKNRVYLRNYNKFKQNYEKSQKKKDNIQGEEPKQDG
jgi:tetratricopeptide (TPR) repeat protein